MAGRKFKFPSINVNKDNMKINVDLKRFEKSFEQAQFWLDSEVMTSMVPYMPHRDGNFINKTKSQSAALAGSGRVVAAAAPTGRFLYEGKVMVDPRTNSPWARKGVKKVVTGRDLVYSNLKATPHWFETAKQKNLKFWIDGVKKYVGRN